MSDTNSKPLPETLEDAHSELMMLRAQVGQMTAPKPPKQVCFVYDIPDASNFPNPSGVLWQFGFRWNLSCWVLPIGELNAPPIVDLLQAMKAAGINYHIIKFDHSEEDKIKEIARNAIQAEAQDIHKRLILNLDAAAAAFNTAREAVEAEHGDDVITASELMAAQDKRRKSRMKSALRSAAERLNAAVLSAERFDEAMNLEDCLKGIQDAIIARRKAFELALTATAGV